METYPKCKYAIISMVWLFTEAVIIMDGLSSIKHQYTDTSGGYNLSIHCRSEMRVIHHTTHSGGFWRMFRIFFVFSFFQSFFSLSSHTTIEVHLPFPAPNAQMQKYQPLSQLSHIVSILISVYQLYTRCTIQV